MRYKDIMQNVSDNNENQVILSNNIEKIKEVQNSLQKSQLNLLDIPTETRFADSLFFDASYHLAKDGQLLRTEGLIQNIRKASIFNLK